jgi:hypothetical protein
MDSILRTCLRSSLLRATANLDSRHAVQKTTWMSEHFASGIHLCDFLSVNNPANLAYKEDRHLVANDLHQGRPCIF